MFFKKFADEREKRDWSIVRREDDVGADLGIGTTKLDFQSSGTRPEEIERLKMWQRGEAMEEEVDFSIQEEMPSGPEAVLEGR